MSLRSPLSRAKGLGSAKTGVHHWVWQRLTALALIPLTLWFVVSVARFSDASYVSVVEWVSTPAVAVALVIYLAALFHHSQLGVQVVIEDYVHAEWLKISSLVLVKFAHVVFAAAAIFAVLKIALGGAA